MKPSGHRTRQCMYYVLEPFMDTSSPTMSTLRPEIRSPEASQAVGKIPLTSCKSETPKLTCHMLNRNSRARSLALPSTKCGPKCIPHSQVQTPSILELYILYHRTFPFMSCRLGLVFVCMACRRSAVSSLLHTQFFMFIRVLGVKVFEPEDFKVHGVLIRSYIGIVF